jgi:putative transposase
MRKKGLLMGMKRSMGNPRSRFNHATAESHWSIFKHDHYFRHTFANLTELTAGVEGYLYRYNTTKMHSKIGKISPINYELGSYDNAASVA